MKRLLFLLALLLPVPALAAAPTFDEAGPCYQADGGAPLAPQWPASVDAGQLAILQIACGNTSGNLCVYDTANVTGFDLLFGPDDNPTQLRQYLFYRVTDGTEDGGIMSIPDSDPLSTARAAKIWLFDGTVGDVEGAAVESQASSTTVADVGVTTTDVDRLAVNFLNVRDDHAQSSFTGETGGDWTLQATCANTGSHTASLQIAAMPSAGTINGGTYTLAGSETKIIRGFALLAGSGSSSHGHRVISSLRAPDVQLTALELSDYACGSSRDTVVSVRAVRPTERAFERAARKWSRWIAQQEEPHCFTIVVSPIAGADGKAIIAPVLIIFRLDGAPPKLQQPWRRLNKTPPYGKVA